MRLLPRRTVAGPLLLAAVLAGCSGGPVAAPRPSDVGPSPSVQASPTTAPATPPTTSPTPSAVPSGPPAVALQELATYSSPVWVGPAPGDAEHLYLVEKTGRLLRLDADGKQQAVVLDLTGEISKGNEQGLLSIAFDPAYATNQRLYADYTGKDGATRVVAYTVVGGLAVRRELLYTVAQPYPNHNGGLLLFDKDGMLLVGLGDGGSAGDPQGRAQDLSSDLGKILRLDPRTGQGAAGNPFPQNPRVWALGLRNPWRFSFDTNGDLYVGDVGQNKLEELDVVKPADQRGANYGWSVFEGNSRFKADEQLSPARGPLIVPALTYLHSEGGCSITGGEVYRGPALPFLKGSYVFGDYCAGRVVALDRTARGVTPFREVGVRVDGLQAFGHDLTGELLVMSAEKLYRLVPA